MPLVNFSGIASGIDSNALIDALLQAERQRRVVPQQNKIDELDQTNSKLDELKSMLASLKDIVYGFATVNGGVVLKQAQSSDETILTASATNSASAGTYTVTVNQLAKNATASLASSSATYTSVDDVIDSSATGSDPDDKVTFTIGTGSNTETVDVIVTNTMTVGQFVDEFNNNSSLATASAVNVGTSSSPNYKIVITTKNVGLEKGKITISVGAGLTGRGVFDSNTTDQATDASLDIAGIGTITRSSNTINDIIPGVTLNLEQQSVTSATLTVGTDKSGTVSKVQEFVDKYNEIIKFLDENNLITREENGDQVTNIFGPLSETSVDENAILSIRSAMSQAKYDAGTKVKIFADAGIQTQRDGTFLLDTEDLEKALDDEPDSVQQLFQNFGDIAGVTGGTIDNYTKFNGLIDTVTNSNDELISDLNDKIAREEAAIAQLEQSLRARFARLESLIGQMQSQQQQLSAVLAGLPGLNG